jgi:hypothetical protein
MFVFTVINHCWTTKVINLLCCIINQLMATLIVSPSMQIATVPRHWIRIREPRRVGLIENRRRV